jgi:SH3 domain protein
MSKAGWRTAGVLLVGVLLATVAQGETAWVKDQVRLNVRTGPSNEHRIVGALETGDEVTIRRSQERWTEVSTADGKRGWIPAGYLSAEMPAQIRLERIEKEAAELRSRVQELETANTGLESSNRALQERESGRNAELERLASENRELKAGARWPEWITGATILSAGMIVGAVLSRLGGRRQSRRIRL